MANLSVNLGHNLEAKAGWNYYQYGEKSFVGPTDSRYFHANNATLGLRWAF
jgi:opacity protein-like surface antigen